MTPRERNASKYGGGAGTAFQLLNEKGVLHGTSPMSKGQVLEALRLMILSRLLDERLTKLQRIGRVGLYGPVHGQEAAVIGPAMALDPARDWIVPASREQPAMLRHGLPLTNMFAAYMGRIEDAAIPANVNLLPRQQAIAAQLPHAVGLAWSLMLRRTTGVVMVYFGEGASSEGDFHEACNLAGVKHVPLIFVLINNHYAISTPMHMQTAAENLASRAEGYGFPGVTVDGNDLLAVYAVSTQAVDRARAGAGPTLIECRTYRVGFHNTSDNPKEYRDETEVSAAIERDPIERVRRFATQEGWWSQSREAETLVQLRQEIDVAQKSVEQLPRPGASAIFDHVYESPPPRLMQQRTEVLRGDASSSESSGQ
jgi:pyruvate dehydrogenase E1 component alpha subunit